MFYTHVYINNNNQKKKKVGPFALLYQFFFFSSLRATAAKSDVARIHPDIQKLNDVQDQNCTSIVMTFAFFSLAVFFHFYFWGLEDHCSVLAPFALFGIDVSLFFFSFLFSVFFLSEITEDELSFLYIYIFFWLPSIDSVWRGRDRVSWRWWSLTSEHDRRFAIEAQKKKKKEKRVRLVIYEGCRNTYASKKKKNNIFWFSVFFFFHFLFLRFPCPFFITIVFFFFSLREVTLL